MCSNSYSQRFARARELSPNTTDFGRQNHSFDDACNQYTGTARQNAHSPINFVALNRRHLLGDDNRRFIYPPKTYTQMFCRKKQRSVGYGNCSHRNVFGGSSSFLPYEARRKHPAYLPQYQSANQVLWQQNSVDGPYMMPYAVLPPITVTAPQATGDVQRVAIDITLRLPEGVGPSGQAAQPQHPHPHHHHQQQQQSPRSQQFTVTPSLSPTSRWRQSGPPACSPW